MDKVYRDLVNDTEALAGYRDLVERAAKGPTSLVFHCSAGKDRTGWGAALLLTLLGVERETVVGDYMESNTRQANTEKWMRLLSEHSGLEWEDVVPMTRVRAEYLHIAFEQVDAAYGSFDAYVSEGLRVNGGRPWRPCASACWCEVPGCAAGQRESSLRRSSLSLVAAPSTSSNARSTVGRATLRSSIRRAAAHRLGGRPCQTAQPTVRAGPTRVRGRDRARSPAGTNGPVRWNGGRCAGSWRRTHRSGPAATAHGAPARCRGRTRPGPRPRSHWP